MTVPSVDLAWRVHASADALRRLAFAIHHTFEIEASITHSPTHARRARFALTVPIAHADEVCAVLRAAANFVHEEITLVPVVATEACAQVK